MTIGNHDPRLEQIRYDGSIVKRDRARRIARHMMDQHRVRIQSSREFDPTWVHWFQKRSIGRRCSCWTLETSPDSNCGVCYGEGIVGPYEKFGYKTHYLDTTTPDVRMVNVVPYPESHHRPVPFALAPGCRFGFVEVEMHVQGSKGLDVFQLSARQSPSASVTGYVRTLLEAEFVELTRESLEQRLPAGGGRVVLRFELSRISTGPGADMPMLSHMMMRYQTSDRILIPIDIPRQNENLQLSELGVIEVLSTLRGWATWEWGKFGPDDFFVSVGTLPESTIRSLSRHMYALGRSDKHQHDMSDRVDTPADLRSELGVLNGLLKTNRISPRLKIIGVEPNEAVGVVTSYDMDLRNVQDYEALYRIPV